MRRELRLVIECGLPERFLARATEAGAALAEVRRLSPRRLAIWTDAAGASLLTGLCRKWRISCRVTDCRGLPLLRRRLLQRWTLLPGCLLCALLCMLLLSRLWSIELSFSGPSAALGDRGALLTALAQEGVQPGMPLGRIDAKRLEEQLAAACPQYSYIGVRLRGVRLQLEAAPEIPAPPLPDRSRIRDLVAARDGVVLSVQVRSGAACVQSGDTVRRGQTLILGQERTAGTESIPVSAQGQVIARCWFEGSAEGYLIEEQRLPTGNERTSLQLRLGSLTIPIRTCEGFDSEEIETCRIPVAGLWLPLSLERTTHIETAALQRERDREELLHQLRLLARAELHAQLSTAGVDANTVSFWETQEQNGNLLRLRAVCEFTSDIAASRDVLEEAY